MTSKFCAKPGIIVLAFFFIFITGVSNLWSFSVDITEIEYSDDSGRLITYDFSAGTVNDNAIQLPESAIARGADESGTTYFWGQAPDLPPIDLTLNTLNRKATISPLEGEGVAVLYAGPDVQSQTGQTPSWTYSIELSNFDIDTTLDKAYVFDIGLGRDDEEGPYNEAFVSVNWVKGFFHGDFYDETTLIIAAVVSYDDNDLYISDIITIENLDPAAATLKIDMSVEDGKTFSVSVDINGNGMTNLAEYTLTDDQGYFERFPDLFPFIFLEVESASTDPIAMAFSLHWKDGDSSGYNLIFSVNDPLERASAVSVTDVNHSIVNGSADLIWNEQNRSWHSSKPLSIGSDPLYPLPVFNFSFVPQQGEDLIDNQTVNITGYVTEFAEIIEPSGIIRSNPVLAWTGISDAAGYGIVIQGQGFNWNRGGLPPDQTSYVYDGPELIYGETYSFIITAFKDQYGVYNSSRNSSSFTYMPDPVICGPGISPSSALYSSEGGSGSFSVTDETACGWTVTAINPWIHITETASGTGNGTVNYTVEPNNGVARSGIIFVEDIAFTVHQGSAGIHPEASVIQSRFESAMERLNASDFSAETGFASFISEDYLDNGEDKAIFVEMVQYFRENYGELSLTVHEIIGSGDRAVVIFTSNEGFKDLFHFRKEGGTWMFYGNQHLFDSWASSLHHVHTQIPEPYWISLSVEDPETSSGMEITGVTVKGPGLPVDGINLYHNTGSGEWTSWSPGPEQENLHPQWSEPPPVPLEYVFSIYYTGGPDSSPAVQISQVYSFVDAAPAPDSIYPGNHSTVGPPLNFSWDSAGEGYLYRIVLYDTNYNFIWESDELIETTVSYEGPELNDGQYLFFLYTIDAYESISMISMHFTFSEDHAISGKGDINNDGVVSLADAILSLKVLADLDSAGIRPDFAESDADVSGEGKIGLAEAIYIFQYISGMLH